MISKETYDKMQEYKAVGLSMLKATEKLGVSYNTVYKWWNKTDEEFFAFQKEHEFVLDNYRQFIIEQLKICPQIDNTGARRGYRNRDTSLSYWVAKANPDDLSDTAIDAIPGATPRAGKQTFVWDMKDANGVRVSDGIYRIMLEGTLYWESNVLCTAVLNTAEPAAGDLPVTIDRSEPNNSQNEGMLTGISITVITKVK